MSEIWRSVDWYDDFYEVSNKGRVRSWKNRKRNRLKEPRIKKQYLTQSGYLRTDLSYFDKCKSVLVHTLVGNQFVPNPFDYDQLNHLDGNKQNNYDTNLQWCTNKQNCIHATQNDFWGSSKLKVEEVRIIKFMLTYMDFSQNDISKIFSVARKTIGDINTGTTWGHLQDVATIDEVEDWVKRNKTNSK